MELYKTHVDVMALNPQAELVGVKTDMLAYKNVQRMIPTHVEKWGEVKIEKIPKVNHRNVVVPGHNIRTDTYITRIDDWNYVDPNIVDVVFENEQPSFINPELATTILETGCLITGMAGAGKSTILELFKFKLVVPSTIDGDDSDVPTYVTTAFTHKACKIINGKTIHKLFGIHPFTLNWSYNLAKSYRDNGITHILIDEISMIPSGLWGVLAHIKHEFGFIFIGFGDWKQLKPVNEEHIDFKNLQLVKYLFDWNHCNLTKIHRFDDNQLLQDAYACADGNDIDTNKYGIGEHDLAIAWTNDCVNALNTRWNQHYAQGLDDDSKLLVDANDKTKIILHSGLLLMSYVTPRNGKYTNSETLTVKSWQKKKRSQTQNKQTKRKIKPEYYEITLQNDDGEDVIVEDTDMVDFRPAYALTVYKAQGMTINRSYSIYEYEKMNHDMRYVALTRTRKKEYVNFCSIEDLKPYTGSIYMCTCKQTGKSYIGSAKDVKKRWSEHRSFKNTDTKFANALRKYGADNFEWSVVTTIHYSKTDDLFNLEDSYILKHDSINNGYNSRLNLKSTTIPNN